MSFFKKWCKSQKVYRIWHIEQNLRRFLALLRQILKTLKNNVHLILDSCKEYLASHIKAFNDKIVVHIK